MNGQRRRFQTKEQDKTLETDVNERNGDLLDKEFRRAVLKMLCKVSRTMHERRENFSRGRKCKTVPNRPLPPKYFKILLLGCLLRKERLGAPG